MAWGWYPKPAPRRPAKNGIAAKKKSGAIGDSWWSRRFVRALEAITIASRLQRGRTYARSGQVSDLVVSAGLVTAKVQGSRARPYDVQIAIAALTARQWVAAEDALASQALFAAALLSGDMPHEIEDLFTTLGTPLFPTRSVDLRTSCSCPDHANPCKHIAATYYLLAEQFDADPFAILAWRGRDRDALVDALRARRAAEDAPAPDPTVAADSTAPAGADLGGFWMAGADALALRFRPDVPSIPDAVLRQLGPLTRDGRDLTAVVLAAYPDIVAHARERAFGV